ncbi:MAG TPA: hypothetical protein VLV32_07420 [Burkholderiales bacterium]|nr:hypothetical protein [Burkholderiales bacterium]
MASVFGKLSSDTCFASGVIDAALHRIVAFDAFVAGTSSSGALSQGFHLNV